MKRNMNQWKQNVLTSSERIAIPIMTYPGLEIIGKNVRETVTNGNTLFSALQALVKAYPPAAVTTIMDLSMEAEAFGSPVRYADDEVPTVTQKIVHDLESVKNLKVPALNAGRIQEFMKTIDQALTKITDIPVLGGIIGPFSLAGRLFDMTEIMTAAMIEPETIHALLEKCTQFLIAFAQEYKRHGASGIVIAEPAAGMLSEEMCKEFSSQYVKRIVAATQDDTFMVILHNCGNTDNLIEALCSTGTAGFHFGNKADMVARLKAMPKDRLVLGNIDPVIVKNGSAEEVYQRTSKLLQDTAQFRNYILSTGCDVPPGTPIANVRAFYQALKDFNNAKASANECSLAA